MKKIIILLLLLIFSLPVSATVLEAGIAIDKVPKEIYGLWRVNSKLENTNSYKTFKPQSVDFWELTRFDNVIKLNNPYTGANAEIRVESAEGFVVCFSKVSNYDDNKILTDTVTLRLDKNEFSGINTVKLEYFSLIDNHLMKTETATYNITGEKISGENILIE